MKIMTPILVVLMLAGCTGNNVVMQEEKVEQLNNLNDHDRDGVITARDNCEQTINGSTISNEGCGQTKAIDRALKLNVHFDKSSAVVAPVDYKKIDTVAIFMKQHMQSNVLIEGHTSKTGSADLNQKLSEQRAKAIAQVLIKHFGIDAQRISTVGYGFERLINQGETAVAHAENRRIVADLSGRMNMTDMIWTIYTVGSE